MGIFSNFFKSNSLPEDEIEESENVMRKLQEARQENTSQWVASIQDPNSILPPTWTKVKVGPAPTIEDVDKREVPDSYVYSPPVEAMYTPFEEGASLASLGRGSNTSSSDWVARIFKEFERQGDVFNLSAQGTNLVFSIHPPQYQEEIVTGGVYGKDAKVRFFKGYVSNTFWGMLLHGHHDKIDVYIVPAEAILQMTLSDISQSGFSPYITIDSQVTNGELEWHVGGTTIHYNSIPNLAKELLADLIKVASGKIKGDDIFTQHPDGLKLDQAAAQTLTSAMRIIKDDDGAPAPVATAVKQAQAPAPAKMVTFEAAQIMIDALNQDMMNMSRLGEGLDDAAQDQMREMATAMRILLGQVSTFVAQYKGKR